MANTSLHLFPLGDVELLSGPFYHASKINEAYVFAHDIDRLLAPFLAEAGLPPKAERYDNWENSGLDGHTAGHFLTSLALMAATGNLEAGTRLNYMIDELARCQVANGNGYVGGIPGSKAFWSEIAAGNIRPTLFTLNERWVPWYNIHKLFAGLRDAYKLTGNEKALEILLNLTRWTEELTRNLSEAQMQQMLITEHGGMNEVFADLYALKGDSRFLTLAKRFSQHEILNPLLEGRDNLDGLHANTQIPKVIGFMRIAQLTNNTTWMAASDFFFQTVVNNRSVAIGGNSTYEHFHPANNFTSMMESREGPETCNTYNMMKLARMLYLSKNNLSYIDFYERALYNHILSSQHPEHGGLVYFTPMRPQHYRVYSEPGVHFWCCVGSGIENHAKYGELIWTHDMNNLFVNLFIPSILNWRDKNVKITQNTAFPDSEKTTLTVNTRRPQKFSINIRYPSWVKEGQLEININDRRVKVEAKPGEYAQLRRRWRDGDRIEVSLPMHTHGEMMPDGSPYKAFLHGPIVLAAPAGNYNLTGLIADASRMGHIASGPLVPRYKTPMIIIDNDNWSNKIAQNKEKPLTFSIENLVYPADAPFTTLIPFFKLHDARYITYWETTTTKELQNRIELSKAREREAMALEAITIDQVQPGQQQPEMDRNFQGENTQAGVHQNRHWRHAAGWFSYDMRDKNNEAKTLRVTYFGLDNNRHFNIVVNGNLLSRVSLDGSRGNTFFNVDYPIPAGYLSGDGVIRVRFEATNNSLAGGIYDVRLLRE